MSKEHVGSDLAARGEAASIYHAMKNGVDMDDVFSIDPEVGALLKEYSEGTGIDAMNIRNAMRFRDKVQTYLDKLIAGEAVEVGVDEEIDGEEPTT